MTNNKKGRKMKRAMSAIKRIRHIFDTKGWLCSYNPNAGVISATFMVSQIKEKLFVILRDADITKPSYAGVMNVCQFPVTIPENRINEVAEFLHRVNSLLVHGGFELDYDDRYCSFKLILPEYFIKSAVSEEIEDMILLPCRMFVCFATGLRKVIGGDLPVKALKETLIYKRSDMPEEGRSMWDG